MNDVRCVKEKDGRPKAEENGDWMIVGFVKLMIRRTDELICIVSTSSLIGLLFIN